METGNSVDRLEQNYPASWYDRLSGWIDRSKLPSWLIYSLIPLLFILIGMITRYLDGSGFRLDWDPINFVAVFQIGYILFICQYLNRFAITALSEFRPALNIDQEKYPNLQRMISTMPARPMLIISMLFGLVGIFLIVMSLAGENVDSSITVDVDFSGFFLMIAMLSLWLANGLFVYHTYYQLSVVNYIFTNLAIVHPFHQRELFAFSGFSARTGIAVVLVTPLWIILDPGSISLIISVIFAIFGVIAFLSPLIGVHNILVSKKEQLLDENAKQMEKTIQNLMSDMDGEQFERLKVLDQKLTSLEKARLQIGRISTWPWRTETIRQLLAAILLPIVIWLLQYFLAQLLPS